MSGLLPDPGWFAGAAALCVVGVGLALWLHIVLIPIKYLLLGAAAFGLCASVGYGYEEKGSARVTAKLQPIVDNLTAKVEAQRDYAAKLVLEQGTIATNAEAKAKESHDATVSYFSGLLAQARADAKANATPAADSTVRVLDAAVSAANTTDVATVAGASGGSPAAITTGASESDVASWGVTCAQFYADASAEVIGLQTFYNNLREAQLKGASP